MPALDNPRHERFAQELAKGKTADEAYQEAGYAANRGNASTLKSNQSVEARVAEIQERAATRAEISVADITRRLLAIAKKCEETDQAPMLAVGRAALMDALKANGMIVEKGELTGKDGAPLNASVQVEFIQS